MAPGELISGGRVRRAIGAIGAVLAGLLVSGCLGGWALEDSGTEQDLFGVFGVEGGDVFAVGAGGTVLHRQGTIWRALESGVEADLHGVWGTGPEQVVVVGDGCTALEYNGDVELPEDGGEPPPPFRALTVEGCPDFRAIHGHAATDANAVGGSRIYWYDGQQISQGGSHAQNLLGIHVNAADDRYLVGDGGVFKHYDGENWSNTVVAMCPVPLVEGACPTDTMQPILWDVWVAPSGVGALVGTFGGLWKVPGPDTGPWAPLETGLSGELRGVHGFVDSSGDSTVETWAVGDNGAVLRLRADWDKPKRQDAGVNRDLYSVWVSADGKHVWAVGAGGTILHLTR